MDLDFGIFVSLTQDSALALLDVARSPRCVEVMEGDEPFLDIRPSAHFPGFHRENGRWDECPETARRPPSPRRTVATARHRAARGQNPASGKRKSRNPDPSVRHRRI